MSAEAFGSKKATPSQESEKDQNPEEQGWRQEAIIAEHGQTVEDDPERKALRGDIDAMLETKDDLEAKLKAIDVEQIEAVKESLANPDQRDANDAKRAELQKRWDEVYQHQKELRAKISASLNNLQIMDVSLRARTNNKYEPESQDRITP